MHRKLQLSKWPIFNKNSLAQFYKFLVIQFDNFGRCEFCRAKSYNKIISPTSKLSMYCSLYVVLWLMSSLLRFLALLEALLFPLPDAGKPLPRLFPCSTVVLRPAAAPTVLKKRIRKNMKISCYSFTVAPTLYFLF